MLKRGHRGRGLSAHGRHTSEMSNLSATRALHFQDRGAPPNFGVKQNPVQHVKAHGGEKTVFIIDQDSIMAGGQNAGKPPTSHRKNLSVLPPRQQIVGLERPSSMQGPEVKIHSDLPQALPAHAIGSTGSPRENTSGLNENGPIQETQESNFGDDQIRASVHQEGIAARAPVNQERIVRSGSGFNYNV